MRWKNTHISANTEGTASAEASVMKWLGHGTRRRAATSKRGPFVVMGVEVLLKKYPVKYKHQATVLSTKLTPDAYSADCHPQIYK